MKTIRWYQLKVENYRRESVINFLIVYLQIGLIVEYITLPYPRYWSNKLMFVSKKDYDNKKRIMFSFFSILHPHKFSSRLLFSLLEINNYAVLFL